MAIANTAHGTASASSTAGTTSGALTVTVAAGECIVDFKTASVIDKKKQGEFEHQLAFYDLLLRENGHETTDALIVQVGDESIREHLVALTDATRAELLSTLEQVLDELASGKWRKGEASEYDDLLKLLI